MRNMRDWGWVSHIQVTSCRVFALGNIDAVQITDATKRVTTKLSDSMGDSSKDNIQTVCGNDHPMY